MLDSQSVFFSISSETLENENQMKGKNELLEVGKWCNTQCYMGDLGPYNTSCPLRCWFSLQSMNVATIANS